MSKARTPEELRDALLDQFRQLAMYWSTVDCDKRTALNGLVNSILATLDGQTDSCPAMDIVCRPHPSDKQYCIDNDEDWVEDGTVISGLGEDFR